MKLSDIWQLTKSLFNGNLFRVIKFLWTDERKKSYMRKQMAEFIEVENNEKE